MYKKKSLKFTYEKVSRDARHAETVKARESSRFKRLSTLRCMDSEDSMNNSNSLIKPIEPKEQQKLEKKPMSRLEMLFKWKQEKQIKQELEMKDKRKPFYAGKSSTVSVNKNVQSMKSSFIAPSNSSFNTSKAVKNKLAAIPNTFQMNKLGNTVKQAATTNSVYMNKQANTVKQIPQMSRIQNSSKQITSRTAFQSSRIPNSKQISSVPKSISTTKTGNNTPTFPKGPIKAVSNSCAPSVNQISSVPKAGVKSYVKAPLKNTPNVGKRAQPNVSVKPKNQPLGSSQLKLPTKILNKPVQKVGALSKPTPNVASALNKTPQRIPSKMPVSGMTQKSTATSKTQPKGTSQPIQNVATRRGFCFKKAVTDSLKQQKETPKISSVPTAIEKPDEKLNEGGKIKCPGVESLSEQSLEIIQDVTFNSDISIIKRPSFAPVNFSFQPIAGLADFAFDDDDPYEILEKVAQKYMSRTSTPSKETERNSCVKSSKESPSSNNNSMHLNKSSEVPANKSTCNTLDVSDLISLKMSLRGESYDESVKQETHEIVASEDVNNEHLNHEISNVATKTDVTVRVHDKSLSSCNENGQVGDFYEGKDAENDFCSVMHLNKSPETPSNKCTCNTLDVSNLINLKTSIRDESFVNKESGDESVNQDTCEVAAGEDVNNEQLNHEISDIETDVAKRVHNKSLENSCNENSLVGDAENDSCSVSLKMDICENQLCVPLENENFQDTLTENASVDSSLLDINDMNKLGEMFEQQIKLEQEVEAKEADFTEEAEAPTCVERKSVGPMLKRFSVLKSSNLKAIVEISETDDCIPNTPLKSLEEQENMFTPRRSKRLSSRYHPDNSRDLRKIIDIDSPACSSPATPRRSLRLQAASAMVPEDKNCSVLLPLEEKSSSKGTPRRSMRLIDLNTPEKDENKRRSKLCMPADFDNLLDAENIDPNSFLVDFESPDVIPKLRSKKVSLLYTPEKTRKSLRKSIRGDLMSFSPAS